MNDSKPGDLSVRIGFTHSFSSGRSSVIPRLEITDGTSGHTLTVSLTPAEFAELISGSQVRVTADQATGFKGLRDFGKYHKMVTAHVPVQNGDYRAEPHTLQHVMEKVDEIEAMDYVCDTPYRNNKRQWVIIGRRYDEQP